MTENPLAEPTPDNAGEVVMAAETDLASLRSELQQALSAMARVTEALSSSPADGVGKCSHREDLEALRAENEALKQRLAEVAEDVVQQQSQPQDSMLTMEILDRLSKENAGLKDTIECKNMKLSALEFQLGEESVRGEASRASLAELQQISARLQDEVLRVDKEKLRLSEMVRQSQEENEVLGKVMERITKDYEALKANSEKQQQQQQQQQSAFQAKSLPEDAVKIQALRNTARALESENELLSRERENLEAELHRLRASAGEEVQEELSKLRAELEAKDAERAAFAEHFTRMEEEKVNVSRRSAEAEAAARRAEERAEAAEAAKTVLQRGLDDALTRGGELEERARATETLAMSLEQTVRMAEKERDGEAKHRNQLEQKLVEQESIYEAKINAMQRELGLRLEEIDANKNEEMSAVKTRYIQMFNEKAEELHGAREALKAAQKNLAEKEKSVVDLQDREEELQNLLGKTRSSLEDEYRGRVEEVRQEVSKAEARAAEVERELQAARLMYEELQESYRGSVQSLARRLHEITALLREHQTQEDEERRRRARVPTPDQEDGIMFSIPMPQSAVAANSISSEDSAVVMALEEKEFDEEATVGKEVPLSNSKAARKRNKARRRKRVKN